MILAYIALAPLRWWIIDPWIYELCEARRRAEAIARDDGRGDEKW
jgi:hypothetical protein